MMIRRRGMGDDSVDLSGLPQSSPLSFTANDLVAADLNSALAASPPVNSNLLLGGAAVLLGVFFLMGSSGGTRRGRR